MSGAWSAVDDYLSAHLLAPDDGLSGALRRNEAEGLPPIDVSDTQGKMLQLFARMAGARRILEVGTLGGYSTIWLARALPEGGRLVTLEIDPHHADVARANLAAAGLAECVEVRAGIAVESLAALKAEGGEPFDFVFVDADKPSNVAYLRAALDLTRPGAVIVVDNVVRGGAILDSASGDPSVHGTRAMFEMLAAEPRIDATAIQTVGAKGWDGFVLAMVR
ncbi:O-methyltransferase [Sphingomonas sp. G-3-2-10]|uniref:O-methyltransferase n=1 Tax=Sphingomonas sp. G-3-2-10 TaxID=2728838 RepID=UPI00146B6C9E|nr:O-methyltransferase [Sphingomonas sp. G-3-2-10]NML05044.1 O-methyltransferase [Sphingomonas sp. G-3-2-10]